MDLDRAVDENGTYLIGHDRLGDASRAARSAAWRRSSGLYGLPIAVSGISSTISTCLGAAARSGTWSAAHAFKLVGRDRTVGNEGDKRDWHLAGVRVGPSDGGDASHGRVLEQRILDRRRVEVVAAADDQVLGATGEPDEAIRVNGGEVAGVEPAVH